MIGKKTAGDEPAVFVLGGYNGVIMKSSNIFTDEVLATLGRGIFSL